MSKDTRDENVHIKRLIEIDKSGLPLDGGTAFNRLIFSTSPYLLQHAENPVDWYPWGDEAFARAAREEKPVFLSIGYATCHWCHAMAHESFEDREVAATFNRSFVCIKVDREERPDIDEEYMAVAQMMTGSGGWPLNIFMTPGKKPFYSATYLPRTPRMGLPGIIELLDGIAGLWQRDRQKVEERSTAILEALSRYFQPNPGTLPDRDVAQNACRQMTESYDELFGGFGSAPKFPIPLNISFLLRSWKRSGVAGYLAMAEHSLRTLRQGGICDQVGFGFHRYTVDRQWLVPHFEKMLYDQALIAIAYMDAFQATGDSFHMRAAEEIFTFVLREMTSSEGGFFAGEDADSEGEEGKYYLWTPAEIASVIGDDGARLFCRIFGVSEKGNFEGRNILHLPIPLETFSSGEGVLPELLAADLEQWRQALLKVREGRVRPFRDEKVVTSWNGLMIAAFARGYALTGEGRYLAAADRAAAFVGTKLTAPSGRLMRSYHLGETSTPGFLEDYAFFILGLIELHQATLEAAYLDRALYLADAMLHLFDGDAGDGLFETGNDCEQLPVRRQNAQDVALPSGNGMAAFDLFRLGRITGDDRFLKTGEVIARTFMGDAARQPLAFLTLISASDYHRGPAVTVTLSGKRAELGEMLRTLHRRFIPDLAVRYGGEDEDGEYPAVGGRPTAHVCARGACLPPVTGSEALNALLDDLG